MDFDSFLASPRWEILKIIADTPSSPIEIAEKTNTTVSYVSQQLKLLDAIGLLDKQKTGATSKGKPRSVFSLKNDVLYLTALTKEFSDKKMLSVSDAHKSILKIWFLVDPLFHTPFERLFWKLHENLKEIEGMYLNNSRNPSTFFILSDSKTLKTKTENFVKTLEPTINFSFISKNQLLKEDPNYITSLYDPNAFLENLKGGLENNDE